MVVRRNLRQPFERVEQVLLEGPATWLPGLDEGQVVSVRDQRFHHALGGPLRVRAGRVERQPGHTLVRVWLEPADPAHHRLPTFDGWLSATALAHRQTRLALHMSYVPPDGRLGAFVDHTVLTGVAEHMVEHLADAITAAIGRRALSLAWAAGA